MLCLNWFTSRYICNSISKSLNYIISKKTILIRTFCGLPADILSIDKWKYFLVHYFRSTMVLSSYRKRILYWLYVYCVIATNYCGLNYWLDHQEFFSSSMTITTTMKLSRYTQTKFSPNQLTHTHKRIHYYLPLTNKWHIDWIGNVFWLALFHSTNTT